MVESARQFFSESEQDHLRCLIRLAVEFNDYLQHGIPGLQMIAGNYQHAVGGHIQIRPDESEQNALKYSIESIFSGIESFCRVNAAYRVLYSATSSRVDWGKVSVIALKEQFVSAFHEFTKETDFGKKCRLLLDLFKIQIVFAGMFYD